ncbi:hypothetical protein BHE74_00023885 [Ensete ventricosum]|nr:hypothetical protein BHE74_00023885 [Ensete ventricosum]
MELKDLVNLRGKFEIVGLHNMASVDYVKDALKDLRHIAKLILSSGINYDNGNLGESDFSLFDGVNEDNQSLSNVHDELHTSTEDGVVRVSVPNEVCLEHIGQEFCGHDAMTRIKGFPSLEMLHFRSMYRWQEWSYVEDVISLSSDTSMRGIYEDS